MLLNSFIGWNESVKVRGVRRERLPRHKFYMYVAEAMCSYIDEKNAEAHNQAAYKIDTMVGTDGNEHRPVNMERPWPQRCLVCKLELGINRMVGEEGLTHGVSQCSNKNCRIWCHTAIQQKKERYVHRLPEFDNLTCFEIAHSNSAIGLWNIRPEAKHPTRINFSHDVYRKLRCMHGLSAVMERKRKRVTEEAQEEAKDEETKEE